MKTWQLIAIAAIVVAAILGWYLYQEANRPILSIDAPGVSVEVNREGQSGVSVEVNR